MSLTQLPELSIIIHYRKDCEDREFNLRTLLRYISTTFKVCDTYVVVDERVHSEEKIPLWAKEYANIIFVQNDDEFRKSFCFNRAAEVAKGGVFCFWDVDALIEAKYIEEAYSKILEQKTYDHVYPFSGVFVDVKKNFFSEFIDTFDFVKLNEQLTSKDIGFYNGNVQVASNISPGGCTMISKEAFFKMGGFDENFIGWGFEDTDFRERSKKINRVGYLDSNALWHLSHNSPDVDDRSKQPHYRNNLQTFNKNAYSA